MECLNVFKTQLLSACRPKVGESRGRAPGKASDYYALRVPNYLDSITHDQTFYQDFGPLNQSVTRVFPPCPPLAGLIRRLHVLT